MRGAANHEVDCTGGFSRLENAPTKNDDTEMTNDVTGECHNRPALPPPPIGEAAALVARLLSESDPPVAVGEGAPSSIARLEHAAALDSILTGTLTPSLPADQNESAPAAPPNAKPLPRYSRTTLSLVIVVVVVLIFGSGLAVGYGVLGRHSKGRNKSTVQDGNSPARLETIADQASLLNAAAVPPVNSRTKLPGPGAPTITHAHSVALPDNGSDNDLQSPAVRPRSEQSKQTHAMAEPRRLSADPSVLGEGLASIKPDPGQTASTIAQAVSIPLSRTPASDSTTQTLGTSAQPVHLEATPTDPVHAENVSPGAKAVDAPSTSAALPTMIPGATDAPALTSSPPAPGQSSPSSLGHIDPCQLVHSVRPVYPREAKKLRVEGDVELRVVVSVEGTVTSVGLVRGPALLVPAAINAAREFRYKPAMLNGKPIETVQTLAMSFNLKN